MEKDMLTQLHPEDAFRLAASQSGKSANQICQEMGWQPTFARRIFSIEKFYPSFADIPKFCRVVGNTIVIDWLKANAMADKKLCPHKIQNCLDLAQDVLTLAESTGKLSTTAKEAILDGSIEHEEKIVIIKVLQKLLKEGAEMLHALKEMRNGAENARCSE